MYCNSLMFSSIQDAREALQNEECLVIETATAVNYQPRDSTSVLNSQAWIIHRGKVSSRWEKPARHQQLTTDNQFD